MDSRDFSNEESDITSLVSSDEINIFNQDTDEEIEEITANSLEPYQFEPIASDMDENDSSSDEELVTKLPKDMSWYYYLWANILIPVGATVETIRWCQQEKNVYAVAPLLKWQQRWKKLVLHV